MKLFLHAPLLAVLSCAVPAAGAQQAPAPSVELSPNEVIWLDPVVGPELVPVTIENLMRSEVLGVTLQVRVDGRDITSVVAPAHEIAFDRLGLTSRSGTRLDLFTIDLSALPLSPGQVIEYRASVTGAGFELFDTETADAEAPEEVPECVKKCLCDFLFEGLGAKQDPNSDKVSFNVGTDTNGDGKVDSEEIEAAIRAAEAELRRCLAECDPPVHDFDGPAIACTDDNGNTLVLLIEVQKDGSGKSSNKNGSTPPGGPDVVIAIGGDADPTSGGAGGNATAKNPKKGGASVALAGNGGADAMNAHNVNNPGNGGEGNALSSHAESGDSYSHGGHGGHGAEKGGNGGEGNGETKCDGSTSFGAGGDGGIPDDISKTGGKGANGSATTGGNTLKGLGSDDPDAGEHGQGGSAVQGSGGGSVIHGGNVNNG